jgi:bifunctional aspartokinase / homoserine dehydrogenase 1
MPSPEQQQASPSAEGDLGPGQRGASRERELDFSSDSDFRTREILAFKFGGSSLDGAERLRHSASLVREAAQSCPVAVVVSAMKGVTDRLLRVAQLLADSRNLAARIEAEAIVEHHVTTLCDLKLEERDSEQVAHEIKLLGRDLLHEVPQQRKVHVTPALFDRLGSFGERLSARLFAAALAASGVPAVPVTSSDFVVTCDNFRHAKPHLDHTRLRGRHVLLPLLRAGIVPVVTGFIGATADGKITTLGRNSSDFSGALIAHIVDAEELVIWTDVDGIYSANPHESNEAQLLHELSYEEAHVLAASGAKVLHPGVLPLAAQTGMTVWVRNTFRPKSRGTRIGAQVKGGAL